MHKLTLAGGEKVYVKIPYNKDKLFRERQILEALKDILPVPKVLDFWEGDEKMTGALLLSAIPGVPCTEGVTEELSYQMGMYHAMLHEVNPPGYGHYAKDGFKFLDHKDWRLHIKDSFEKWKEDGKTILDPELYERAVLHFDGVFSVLPELDGPCLVHMDFRPGNLLVDGNKVVGLIDFESARGGSTEIDFTKMNRYSWRVNPRTKLAYRKGYESVRLMINLETVLPFYEFYDAFSAVVWCKNRGLEKNLAFLQENISTLRKSVSEPFSG
ncbi:phosphotransferase family protein [Paenibacillus aurantius]|uniref:phosphotransferase family protein n=1 Tax=Paenibacillus aurantius TaxID=2918900 RepID=UPI0028EE26D6|nr:aminoglycoside phosphotransferase family protein [Paenibacillus aurantius]